MQSLLFIVFLTLLSTSYILCYGIHKSTRLDFPRVNHPISSRIAPCQTKGSIDSITTHKYFMASTNVDPSADLAPKTGDSKTAQYLMCSTCKSAYVADETLLNSRVGLRVRCGVCEKEWFQSIERLSTLDNSSQLGNMSEEKIADVKRILAESNFPKYPRVDRIGLFVGNLPYSYDDKDLLDLFCDYGVTSVALVRDNEGLSKGFAFVEVSTMQDAELAVKEMHLFHTDASRRLTVRLQTPKGNDRTPSTGRSRDARPGSGGEKTWVKKSA